VSGRRWAYAGAGLGAAVSVAANVAHSYVPPPGAAAGWTPHAGSVGLSAFWPIAVLVAVEILARVSWPSGARWVALRWAGLVPVATVAAIVSYRHLAALLAFYGDDRITAGLGPLAVDGLMVMATGALIATSRQGAKATGAAAEVMALSDATEPEPGSRPTPSESAASAAPGRTGAGHAAERVVAADAWNDGSPQPVTARQIPAGPPRRARKRQPAADVDALLLVGRTVAQHLEHEGERLTRAALIAGLHERGHAISTTRATELLRQLRAA
jgi:hypothetical protein